MLQQVFAGLGGFSHARFGGQVREPRAQCDWLWGLSAEPQRLHCERFAGKTQWFSRGRREPRPPQTASRRDFGKEIKEQS